MKLTERSLRLHSRPGCAFELTWPDPIDQLKRRKTTVCLGNETEGMLYIVNDGYILNIYIKLVSTQTSCLLEL